MSGKIEISRKLADDLVKALDMNFDPGACGPLEELRDLLAAPVVERQPVAYAVFADNGNIRCWSRTNTATGLLVASEDGAEIVPLYTSPPAPVAVVLPERKTDGRDRAVAFGWNACLDKVKELNQ